MSDLTLVKAILEIRFPTNATLFDRRGEIANNWQWRDDLSDWEISQNQVTIRNKSKSKFLSVGLRNAVVVFEMPSGHKDFCQLSEDFIKYVLQVLEPKKIERIGLRFLQISEEKHFKLLVNSIRKKLYRLSDADWDIFGGFPEDVAFPIVLKLDENRANVHFGPMLKEQLSGYFESGEVKEKLPEVSLFVDFDLYRTNFNITPKEYPKFFHSFLEDGCSQIFSITSRFLDHFKGFK